MKKVIAVLCTLVLSIVFIAGCKKKTVPTDINKSTVEETKQSKAPEGDLQSIVVNPEYMYSGSTDSFTLLSKRISGDTLLLEVQYGGGCKDHVFVLNTNMRFLKSMPPQLNLRLEHENNDDMCRALITKSLQFDLKSVQTESSESVKLILDGDTENKLNYRYK